MIVGDEDAEVIIKEGDKGIVVSNVIGNFCTVLWDKPKINVWQSSHEIGGIEVGWIESIEDDGTRIYPETIDIEADMDNYGSFHSRKVSKRYSSTADEVVAERINDTYNFCSGVESHRLEIGGLKKLLDENEQLKARIKELESGNTGNTPADSSGGAENALTDRQAEELSTAHISDHHIVTVTLEDETTDKKLEVEIFKAPEHVWVGLPGGKIGMLLDFFNGKLRVLAYRGGQEEPNSIYVIAHDPEHLERLLNAQEE